MSKPTDLKVKWFQKYGHWIHNIKKDIGFVATDMLNFVNSRNEVILSCEKDLGITSSSDITLNRDINANDMEDVTYFIYETFPLVQKSSELTYQLATAMDSILTALNAEIKSVYQKFKKTQPTSQLRGYNQNGHHAHFCNNLDHMISLLYREVKEALDLLYKEILNIVEIEFDLNVVYHVYPQIWHFIHKEKYDNTNYSQFIMASFMDYKKVIDDICKFIPRTQNALDEFEKVVNKYEKVKIIVANYIELRLYTINFDQISMDFTDYDPTDYFVWSRDLPSQKTIEINGIHQEYSIPKVLSNKVSEYHESDSIKQYFELYSLYNQLSS
jgi:hypothetical protein